MSEASRLAAISAFLLKHRSSPVFRSRREPTPGVEPPDATESAETFTRDLEALGPTFVKIGQMLSTRPDMVPPDYLVALSRLQDDVKPASAEEITQLIEEELGAPMDKLFREFEPVPVGTASFAQVHRAVLPSGRQVAVKVQRPAVAAQVDTDLAAVERLIRSLGLVSGADERYGFSEWLEEFRATVRAELDYRQEADNLDTFHDRLREYENIGVPTPVWDYTRRRVLVMDYVDGIQVTTIPGVLRTEVDLKPLAHDLGKAYLDQVFVHGLIHADPHPGNVKLTADHRLVLLDLGMVGYVPPRLRDQLLKLVVATIDGRGEQAAETFVHMGTRLEDFDEARFSRETARLVARFSSATTWTESEGGFLLKLVELGGQCGLKPPAELTLLGKTLLNLESVILALDPDASLREVLRLHMHGMLRDRTLGKLDMGRLATEVLEVQELVREAPQRLSVLLRTLADNRFRVHVAGLEEAHLIESMQKIANRITAGVIAAAMVVGAALIMDIPTPHTLLGYPALALVLFLGAVVLGAALVVSSLLGDRRARPKAEKDPL
ncbi:ABC1 kinase family protein [Arenimonas sp.]|uniref:ABC1 kinase family protein n=1 Tax=Arenimonas sp. TaxID=1872635 RepID=UPI0035B1CDA8